MQNRKPGSSISASRTRNAQWILVPLRQAHVEPHVQGGDAAGLQIQEGEQKIHMSLFYPLTAPVTLPCTQKFSIKSLAPISPGFPK